MNNLERTRRIIGLQGILAEQNPELPYSELRLRVLYGPDADVIEDLEREVGWNTDVPLHLYIGAPGVELPAQETAVVEMMEPFEVSMTDATILVRDCREPTTTPPVALFRLNFPDATMHAGALAKKLNDEHQEAMRRRTLLRESTSALESLTTHELAQVNAALNDTRHAPYGQRLTALWKSLNERF